jgi:hypothetical protein
MGATEVRNDDCAFCGAGPLSKHEPWCRSRRNQAIDVVIGDPEPVGSCSAGVYHEDGAPRGPGAIYPGPSIHRTYQEMLDMKDAVYAQKKPEEIDKPVESKRWMVGGDHYLKCKIQPLDYILANELGFVEGGIVKYVTRWKNKGGVQDLEKARDLLDKYITDLKKEQK